MRLRIRMCKRKLEQLFEFISLHKLCRKSTNKPKYVIFIHVLGWILNNNANINSGTIYNSVALILFVRVLYFTGRCMIGA